MTTTCWTPAYAAFCETHDLDPTSVGSVARFGSFTRWQAKMSEANDAIGAARDALRALPCRAGSVKAAEIYEEIEFWTNKRAFLSVVAS